MLQRLNQLLILLVLISSCSSNQPSSTYIGKFQVEKDLFLAHFDCKTDVDDVNSVAGILTILSDPRFSKVRYHAVVGTYGIQEGLYVPANELFDTCFGNNWSDAHENFKRAVTEETTLVMKTLNDGGNIWIAEAGQSDFTAAVIRNIKKTQSSLKTTKNINVVQHSEWNENMTSSENLDYVKINSSYHKIPDGNVIGNGSPGLIAKDTSNLRQYISDLRLLKIWNMAIEIANNYNGKDNRYENSSITNGGLDFSDVSEACWIFGFNDVLDTDQFFNEFSSISKN